MCWPPPEARRTSLPGSGNPDNGKDGRPIVGLGPNRTTWAGLADLRTDASSCRWHRDVRPEFGSARAFQDDGKGTAFAGHDTGDHRRIVVRESLGGAGIGRLEDGDAEGTLERLLRATDQQDLAAGGRLLEIYEIAEVARSQRGCRSLACRRGVFRLPACRQRGG
jgi:hypothetical protein